MRKDCFTCEHRYTDCAQGLMTLPLKDLLAWCKEAKKRAGVTNAQISEMTGIPIGTLERIMAGKIEDAKFSTIQPVASVLLGLTADGFACQAAATANDAEIAQLRHRAANMEQLEAEKEKLERHLAALRENHAKELETVHADTRQRVDYLKRELTAREAHSTRLLRCLIALGAFDILILTLDMLIPTIGFFRW